MLDFAIVVAFVLYGIGAGLRARKQASKDLTEYFLAGRSIGGIEHGVAVAGSEVAKGAGKVTFAHPCGAG
jgi:Na+(H+)/acetate symporter ActP